MTSHPTSAWFHARFAPPSPHPRRRSALAAAFLLLILLLTVLQSAAWAQQSGPSLDPPGRVARLNLAEGPVSFAAADSGTPDRPDWTAAELNRPLTGGDRLWTGPRARSELHMGSTAIRMSEQTSLDFLTLDDSLTQLHLAQGSLQLRVRTLFEGQRLEIDTPNLTFVISQPGDYRLDANPASDTTRVVVQAGNGTVYGDNNSAVTLLTQQQASFSGTQLAPAAPGAAQADSFDLWAADRDRREDQSVSARYIPREITGYQQLDDYGDWRQDLAYGAIWLPRSVPVHWAPYSMGHWGWIAPWGWTWVDDAPWGFAPFHYGRWAQIGPRWAWVPGRLPARPVYAPALVAFVGGGSGGLNWNISIGTGGPRPGIGWFPLAPGEAFRPAYRASPRYIAQMNNNIVINNTTNVNNVYRYQRQPAAVTAISRDDFVRGRPVHGSRQALSAADLNRAPVVTDRSALPQRPEMRERLQPAAALPPAAIIARPVVANQGNRRGEGREAAQRQEDPRAARPDNRPGNAERNAPAEARTPAQPLPAGVLGAQPPATRPGRLTPPAPDRSAIDAGQRVPREQQQLQRDQERQQQDALRRQADESQRQRALRDQAQKNGSAPAVNPEARAAAERNAMEQAQRAQQQQRAEQAQHRQNEEALSQQRAMREQQAQKQQELARQQQVQQQAQQQAQQQQRAEQAQQRRQSEEALNQQRAMHEQAQRQQEQVRQQQQQAQQQQRAEQAQQRQASEQQRQQEVRRAARPADNTNERGGPRPEGRPKQSTEQ
ncbi:DUF6600 domain-containing protein [Polaromonas sp. UC242_47]|uniref:DUF6600 domain-containing protein n=1 Tax=Polaromonas sp. UC242_47 TaxID=3374626 RepID=UPI0037BD98B7